MFSRKTRAWKTWASCLGVNSGTVTKRVSTERQQGMSSGGFHSDAKFKGLYTNKKPSIQVTITASIDSYKLHDSLCDVLRIL